MGNNATRGSNIYSKYILIAAVVGDLMFCSAPAAGRNRLPPPSRCMGRVQRTPARANPLGVAPWVAANTTMPKAPGGVLPRRTADPQECRDIALADGAVVLTQLPEPVAATAGGCAELPVHVWGEQLRGYARPCEISISLLPESAGAAAGRQITFESFQGKAGVDLAEIVRAVNAGELQVSDADQMGTTDYAHTDGWAGEVQQPGVDLRPDFFFLVCEE